MKTKTKTVILLALVSLLFTNCSNEQIDSNDDINNEVGFDVTYHYKGESFKKEDLSLLYGDNIFENTEWLMEDNENAYLFDDDKERESYLSEKYENDFAGAAFIVFHSGDWGRGQSLWRRSINGYPKQNLYGYWKNRARSVSTRNVNTVSTAVLFDRQWFRGARLRIFIPPSPNPINLNGFKRRAESFNF